MSANSQAPAIAIALTTINRGEIVTNVAQNLRKHGYLEEATIYAIPDVSTPKEFYTTCADAVRDGCRVVFPTMDEQESFLKMLPDCPPIPERTDNRRNVGFLMAIRDGTDFLLSLDDDNFFDDDVDCIADHLRNLEPSSASLPLIESSDRFYNCCHPLRTKVSCEVYPRGYPLAIRHKAQTLTESTMANCPTWINAGLWIESPDIDAFQWLAFGQQAQSDGWEPCEKRLSVNTWCPVNSQNTMLSREILPAYYYLPMRGKTLEIPMDRHGDILSGYFALKCAKVHGATVNFGSPIARHIRNQHDYTKDFSREMLFLGVIDEFLEWLVSVDLRKGTVAETYLDLANALHDQADRFTGATWTPGLRAHFRFMADCMRKWLVALEFLAKQ